MANCAARRDLVDKRDFRSWPEASVRCLAEFGRYRGNIGLSPPNALKIYGFTA